MCTYYEHIGNEKGELLCCGCQRVLGTWDWKPSNRSSLNNLLKPPLIRIHKNVVTEGPIALDNTPNATPRTDETTAMNTNVGMDTTHHLITPRASSGNSSFHSNSNSTCSTPKSMTSSRFSSEEK